MLRGYRGIIAALVGLSIVAGFYFLSADLASVGHQIQREATNRADKYRDDASNQKQDRCLALREIAAADECERKADQAARENQRVELDLAAQQMTAWWTQVMAIAALVGMALSAVGVWLVWTTFRATSQANIIASKTLISENRAWLKVSPGFRRLHIDGDMMVMHDIKLHVENIGKSVARRVTCWCSLHAVPDDRIIGYKFDDIPEPSVLQNDTLQNIWPDGDSEFTRDAHGRSPLANTGIRGSTFKVLLRIKLEYQTIFEPSETRTTELVIELFANNGFSKDHIGSDNSRAYNVGARLETSGGGTIT